MAILNLTQHAATQAQKDAGVFDVLEQDKGALTSALTFTKLPTKDDIEVAAAMVCAVASNYEFDAVMIGGALWLMSLLERNFKECGVQVLYAYSERKSVEKHNEDGTVTKTMQFEHIGFVAV